MDPAGETHVRIDKWLWAARFFKTRAQAADAVAGGKVKLNGERVKVAKIIRIGDELNIHLSPFVHVIRVMNLSAQRGPAPVAALLYEETVDSRAGREALAARLALERVPGEQDKGRPTKKARRQIVRFTSGG